MHVSARTKHIDIRHHYVREHIKSGRGEIIGEKSENNFADILTKNVYVAAFQKLGQAILNGFAGWIDKFKFEKDQREPNQPTHTSKTYKEVLISNLSNLNIWLIYEGSKRVVKIGQKECTKSNKIETKINRTKVRNFVRRQDMLGW